MRMHKEDEMTEDYSELAIVYYLKEKDRALNSKWVPREDELDRLIADAETLELPASVDQLTKFRDNYYPREQE